MVAAHEETDAYGAAILGRRSQQQDCFCIRRLENRRALLLVLGDGMGGHPGGDQASRLAVNGFSAAFVTLLDEGATIEAALRGGLDSANACIRSAQQQEFENSTMGTTLVAVYLSASGIAWISVGDSPLWLFRSGQLQRVNEDHSLRQLKKEGAHVSGNMLRSAVAGDTITLVDCPSAPLAIDIDDLVILASDGILTLSEAEITEVLQKHRTETAQKITERLLDAIDERKDAHQDNCAIVVAGCTQLGRAGPFSSRFRGLSRMIARLTGTIAAIGSIACMLPRLS